MKVRPRTNLMTFSALLVLLALTIGVAYIDLGAWNQLAALVIAFTKAILVVLIFMHGIYGGRHVWGTVGVALIWLLILVGSIVFDVATRNLYWFKQY